MPDIIGRYLSSNIGIGFKKVISVAVSTMQFVAVAPVALVDPR